MKTNSIILCLFLSCFYSFAQPAEHLFLILPTLDRTLAEKERYSANKETKIYTLQKLLTSGKLDKMKEYEINRDLFHIYKAYKCDSAVFYANKNVELARTLKVEKWVEESQLQMASQLSVLGMFKEALEILHMIDTSGFTTGMLSYYYETCKLIYKNYSYENAYEEKYSKLSNLYREALIDLLDSRTDHYKLVYAEKLIDEDKTEEAKEILLFLLDKSLDESTDYAYITYLLSEVYKKEENAELQKVYLALSAITDIKNANKKNVALQTLAIALYESGDIDRAYEYSRSSIEDALFCHVRLRTAEISRIFPIVDTVYKLNSRKTHRQLRLSLNLLALFILLLLIAVFYVYSQLKKLREARRKLKKVNDQLNQLNLQLSNSNLRLHEANHIKEEYIGHFLDLCSNYIEKLENYRKMLNKKAAARQMDELYKALKSKDILEKELEELYRNFDTIFLQLYPNFVNQVNALLIPEERFVLRPSELLNAELRIYALIRLGIQDSAKIAHFLRYSANTIYNYRAKVKSKSFIPREEFEKRIMEIGSLENN